jgi:regulator of protease activity HflC (stomatin/prohibitin superfamily)
MADQDLEILSRDGLSMKINIVYRFQLYQDAVPVVHQYVGSDWAETLVRPEVAARARDVLSQNTPAEIYASRRSDIEQQILGSVRSHLYSEFEPVNAGLSALDDRQSIPIPRKTPLAASRFFDLPKHSQCRDQKRWNHLPWITVDAVLIRAITLPHAVAAAIERKNEQQQALQEYDYRLQREQKESARKQIEAQGIAAFQRTVSGGITDDYLRWRGIEATLALARSSNSKVVVIGSGKDGLPIILGNDPGQGPGPRRSR